MIRKSGNRFSTRQTRKRVCAQVMLKQRGRNRWQDLHFFVRPQFYRRPPLRRYSHKPSFVERPTRWHRRRSRRQREEAKRRPCPGRRPWVIASHASMKFRHRSVQRERPSIRKTQTSTERSTTFAAVVNRAYAGYTEVGSPVTRPIMHWGSGPVSPPGHG
jgi:hypothetical protein